MRVKGQGMMGFCQNPLVLDHAKTKVFVCSDDDTAKRCRVFGCRNTEESVRGDFDAIMKSPARCGHDYPKLAMLIWFLQEYENSTRFSRLRYEIGKLFVSFFRTLFFRWW